MSSRILRIAFPALLIALLLPANVGAAEIVKDGSFEGTSEDGDNPNWAQGGAFAPICDERCGDGGGTAGPRTGSHWAWFGGVFSPDFQSVIQEVTIPPGTATLTFYLRLGRSSGNGLDTLRVFLGNEELFSLSEEAPGYDSYKLVTLDVTKHAGAGAEDLSFEYEGFGGTPTNFSVDHISLQAGPAGAAAVSLKGPKKVAEGKKAKLTVSVQPCAGHAGETVELFRGKKKVGTGAADAACITKFKVKMRRTSTFRAVSPAGTSNNLKVRVRR